MQRITHHRLSSIQTTIYRTFHPDTKEKRFFPYLELDQRLETMTTSPPRIAIIGAGPAGLTLARLLHVSKAHLDLTLYELDASPTSRPEHGGTLDLHTDTGLAALHKCNLWEAFQKYARYDAEELIIADKNATEFVHLRGGEKRGAFDRPEIDRERLKEILLNSVPEKYVRWGWHLREVTEEGMLRFDGREKLEGPFDLVVGGDGAWSKVRTRLNGLKPKYAGVSGFQLAILEPAKTCPHVDKLLGRGSYFACSDQKYVTAQRLGNNSIKTVSWFECAEGAAKEMMDQDGKEGTLAKILERHADWVPEIMEFFRQSDPKTLRHWVLYELPVGFKWEHRRGFTLIGDAASLMTPFAGEGVNKAMKDALELAELIEQSQDPDEILTLDEAVLRYEKEMFPRAEKIQAMTMRNKKGVFGEDAPIGFMVAMIKSVASESPSVWMNLAGTWPFVAIIYGYFWIRKQAGWAVRNLWRQT